MDHPSSPAALYHISQTPGITVFQPRRCWFDATRNGSGMLAEGAEPPEGCTVHYCVFAGDARLVRYFCIPSRMKRFSIRRVGDSFAAAAAALGLPGEQAEEALVLEQRDEAEIRAQRMHLYEFDPSPFVRFPAGEYVAEQPVVPRSERALQDPLTEMRALGIHPHFVADIEQRFEACLALGAAFGLVANIEGSLKLLRTTPQ